MSEQVSKTRAEKADYTVYGTAEEARKAGKPNEAFRLFRVQVDEDLERFVWARDHNTAIAVVARHNGYKASTVRDGTVSKAEVLGVLAGMSAEERAELLKQLNATGEQQGEQEEQGSSKEPEPAPEQEEPKGKGKRSRK